VFWAFPFEKFLGYVNQFVHGTTSVETQLAKGCMILEALPKLDFGFKDSSHSTAMDRLLKRWRNENHTNGS